MITIRPKIRPHNVKVTYKKSQPDGTLEAYSIDTDVRLYPNEGGWLMEVYLNPFKCYIEYNLTKKTLNEGNESVVAIDVKFIQLTDNQYIIYAIFVLDDESFYDIELVGIYKGIFFTGVELLYSTLLK